MPAVIARRGRRRPRAGCRATRCAAARSSISRADPGRVGGPARGSRRRPPPVRSTSTADAASRRNSRRVTTPTGGSRRSSSTPDRARSTTIVERISCGACTMTNVERGARREAERFVDADRGDVLGDARAGSAVSPRASMPAATARTSRGREPALARGSSSVHTALDLGVARQAHALAGHRDELAVAARSPRYVPSSTVRVEERAGLRALDEREHLGDIVGRRAARTSASGSPIALGRDHLQRRKPERRRPTRRAARRSSARNRTAAPPGPRSVAQRVPGVAPRRRRAAPAKARDLRVVAQREAGALGRTGPADRSARAKRGCRAAPRPRWCHA